MAYSCSPALSAPPVRCYTLLRQPDVLEDFSILPENIDGNSAARIPVATITNVMWLKKGRDFFANCHHAILMKGSVVAERGEIEFQRFAFQQPFPRHVID